MVKESIDIVLDSLPERIKIPLQRAMLFYEDRVSEIVLRSERPVCIYEAKEYCCITESGMLSDSASAADLLISSAQEIEQTVLRLCSFSVYAYQNEINSGFITIGGGVRVGICGKAVMTDGRITNIRNISTLSFRIARDIRDCSSELLKSIEPLSGALLCGAPGSGKTTMIRDMARRLSYRYRVSLLDERGELSAFSRTGSGFSLGLCDIYAGYPKGSAANQAIRSMAPDIIVCDEMGDEDDAAMLMYSMRCGVSFIATVHASSINDLRNREITSRLIGTGAFRYIAFLASSGAPGQVEKIYEMRDAGA